jgi:transposase
MSATAAGAIGNLDPFEQPPQGEGSDDADPCEQRAHLQVLRQRRVQAEDREDQDLGDHGNAVADDHVCDGFDERHGARLLHVATSSTGQQFSCERSQRMRRNQRDHAVATEAKPVHPVGQPISASTNSGFKIPWAVDRDRRSGSVGLLRHPSAQETAMNKPSPAIIMPAAIRTDLGAIFVSLELSRSRWIVTSLSPGGAEKMSKHSVPGGDLAGLMERFQLLVAKAKARTGRDFPIVTIQEAGLDGFWIHRALVKEGIESHVVDPASIATSRRRRRAKTDRIDGEALVRALLAFKRGEPRVCAMVRAPSPAEEDARRIMRERKTLTGERVAHVNRIKGLLFAQGVSGYEPLRRDRRKRLEELRTGDGRELPRHLTAQILRELDRLELLLAQIKAVEAERDAELAQARQAALPASAARLLEISGGSARNSPCCSGRRGSIVTSTTEGRWPPMRAWRRRRGRAERSTKNKACRKPAIRGCAPR